MSIKHELASIDPSQWYSAEKQVISLRLPNLPLGAKALEWDQDQMQQLWSKIGCNGLFHTARQWSRKMLWEQWRRLAHLWAVPHCQHSSLQHTETNCYSTLWTSGAPEIRVIHWCYHIPASEVPEIRVIHWCYHTHALEVPKIRVIHWCYHICVPHNSS